MRQDLQLLEEFEEAVEQPRFIQRIHRIYRVPLMEGLRNGYVISCGKTPIEIGGQVVADIRGGLGGLIHDAPHSYKIAAVIP